MDIEKYLELSAKTLSSVCYAGEMDPMVIKIGILSCIKDASALDIIKKALFYGKVIPALKKTEEDPQGLVLSEGQAELLHFAIGMVTEAAEVLEAVYDHVFLDVDLDVVNIREELGDLAWYASIFMRRYGVSQEEIFDINIAKLSKRYGDTFSSKKALNRDLDSEREILTSSPS